MMNRRHDCAVFLAAALVLIAVGSAADGHAGESAGSVPQGVVVMADGGAPLTGVVVSPGSLVCTRGSVAVAADGSIGVLAPRIGPNVLRGSADLGQTVWWEVVPTDRASGGGASELSICRLAQ